MRSNPQQTFGTPVLFSNFLPRRLRTGLIQPCLAREHRTYARLRGSYREELMQRDITVAELRQYRGVPRESSEFGAFACGKVRIAFAKLCKRKPTAETPSGAGEVCLRSNAQRMERMTWMSRSLIFLRRVLRLTPRSSAALIWLPRVAARAAPIRGSSISRRMR